MNKRGFFGLIITLIVIALVIGGVIFFLQLKNKIFDNDGETELAPGQESGDEEIIVSENEENKNYIENLLDI